MNSKGGQRHAGLRKRLISGYVIVIFLLLIPLIYTLSCCSSLSTQYGRLIGNVAAANSLMNIVEDELPAEMWNVVSGKKTFEQGSQYEILDRIRSRLTALADNAGTTENRQIADVVAVRTLDTLSNYVDQIGSQIKEGMPTEQVEQVLDEVRSVSRLLYGLLQDYTRSEIDSAEHEHQLIQRSVIGTFISTGLIIIAVVLLTISMLMWVAGGIVGPIDQLKNMASSIAQGDLSVRSDVPAVRELGELTESLNQMAHKIRQLLDTIVAEQKNLQKSEMRAMQAQIKPHFLYNTFDTIGFLVESNMNDEAMQVTRAFSSFFRISLSGGRDYITVEKEIEHIQSYLTIQKIRYSDILDYRIDVDDGMMNVPILKLLLQPLVENALYHGIKNRRVRGLIEVMGSRESGNMRFEVRDNGIGMESAMIESLLKNMESVERVSAEGYGLYNVNQRLRLFYGSESSLRIQSAPGIGTKVSFLVPAGRCLDV